MVRQILLTRAKRMITYLYERLINITSTKRRFINLKKKKYTIKKIIERKRIDIDLLKNIWRESELPNMGAAVTGSGVPVNFLSEN